MRRPKLETDKETGSENGTPAGSMTAVYHNKMLGRGYADPESIQLSSTRRELSAREPVYENPKENKSSPGTGVPIKGKPRERAKVRYSRPN